MPSAEPTKVAHNRGCPSRSDSRRGLHTIPHSITALRARSLSLQPSPIRCGLRDHGARRWKILREHEFTTLTIRNRTFRNGTTISTTRSRRLTEPCTPTFDFLTTDFPARVGAHHTTAVSFSCPHFRPDDEACLRLNTDCVPGRRGCVIKDAVFAVPAEVRVREKEEEKRRKRLEELRDESRGK